MHSGHVKSVRAAEDVGSISFFALIIANLPLLFFGTGCRGYCLVQEWKAIRMWM